MQHHRKFPDKEVEITEAGAQNYVGTLQTHLLITRKAEMDSVKYSNSSKSTQAISNWRNGKLSSINYQLFWCLNSWHRYMTPRPVLKSLGSVTFLKPIETNLTITW